VQKIKKYSDVSLFVTCLGDTFYPKSVRSALNVFEKLGLKVNCPLEQTCCGQPMFNAGYFNEARDVARTFINLFSETEGPIVSPSSSCAAMVRKHYPNLFRDDSNLLAKAIKVGERTFEFSEFLVKKLDVDLGNYSARFCDSVTFHRSCHFRALDVFDEPVDLIRQIDGVEYIPLTNLEQCCGFGGTFSVNFPHLSSMMAGDKVRAVKETGANKLIFADAGCAMNITGCANRMGTPIEAMHIAELIDEAIGG